MTDWLEAIERLNKSEAVHFIHAAASGSQRKTGLGQRNYLCHMLSSPSSYNVTLAAFPRKNAQARLKLTRWAIPTHENKTEKLRSNHE